MRSLPAWAVWAIVVPLVLLSPVIAFFLAIAAEIVVGAFVDAGAPGLALLGAAFCALILARRLGSRRRRPLES